jgi:integrase
VLNAYASEHLPETRAAANAAYQVAALAAWWVDRRVTDINKETCREYISSKTRSAARRDLETLRAAVNYWHGEYGPLEVVPKVVMPEKSAPRNTWLKRSDAAKLLRAGRHVPHLARFILLGLYTGSRAGVLLRMKWKQVDLERRVMYRLPEGEVAPDTKQAPPVRLGERILFHLRRWRRLDGVHTGTICHFNGARVAKMRRSWGTARTQAGLPRKVTPHTLRHTRATWLMQAGINPWEAAGSLGMSVETLWRVYGHHHPDWQKNAAEV